MRHTFALIIRVAHKGTQVTVCTSEDATQFLESPALQETKHDTQTSSTLFIINFTQQELRYMTWRCIFRSKQYTIYCHNILERKETVMELLYFCRASNNTYSNKSTNGLLCFWWGNALVLESQKNTQEVKGMKKHIHGRKTSNDLSRRTNTWFGFYSLTRGSI